ncbi:hypothetical protein G9298_18960 [Bacillus thuringiensis]|nr:hypothetical protein G9298_18960 [Bacillus thuringiensis]
MSSAILTIILLLMAFYFKLTVSKKVTLPNFLQSIAELPVDIMFTSTTFIISFRFINADKIMGKKDFKEMDLYSDFIYFAVYILITVIVISIWRHSIENMDKGKWWWFAGLVILAYLFSVSTLIIALSKMKGVI